MVHEAQGKSYPYDPRAHADKNDVHPNSPQKFPDLRLVDYLYREFVEKFDRRPRDQRISLRLLMKFGGREQVDMHQQVHR